MSIETINPTTDQLIKSYQPMSMTDASDIIQKTHQAFLLWKRTCFDGRSQYMRRVTRILRYRIKRILLADNRREGEAYLAITL